MADKESIPRRDFLKGAGVTGVAAAAASLAACNPQTETAATAQAAATQETWLILTPQEADFFKAAKSSAIGCCFGWFGCRGFDCRRRAARRKQSGASSTGCTGRYRGLARAIRTVADPIQDLGQMGAHRPGIQGHLNPDHAGKNRGCAEIGAKRNCDFARACRTPRTRLLSELISPIF